MRQLTFIRPGTLEWREVAEPGLEGPQEAIVRPIAVGRCDLDGAIVGGRAPFEGPFAIGHEFVAEIVALGEGVAGFQPGQRVIVPYHICCGRCPRFARWSRAASARASGSTSVATYGFRSSRCTTPG